MAVPFSRLKGLVVILTLFSFSLSRDKALSFSAKGNRLEKTG